MASLPFELEQGGQRFTVEVEQCLIFPTVARTRVGQVPAIAGYGRPCRVPVEDTRARGHPGSR